MSPRPVLPVSLYLDRSSVLLVGDGALADERFERLTHASADLRRCSLADYRADMCDGVFLVLAMTDDREADRRVAADARARGALAYAHDQPEVSDLAMPAVSRRGPLALAISTDGLAPALARRLREELDRLLLAAGPRIDALVAELVQARASHLAAGRAEALYQLARRLQLVGKIVVDD